MSDYISREATLAALQDPELFNVSPIFLKIIRDLPAADVEPKREWNAYPAQKPKKSGKYFAAVESEAFPGARYIDVLQYDEIGWRDGCCYVSGASHWMPLPALPKEEGTE